MKVLILSASVGSGHVRAAEAIEQAFLQRHPQVHVEVVDVLDLANRAFRKLYGDGYLGLARSAPHLLGFLYDMFDRPPTSITISDSMRRAVQRWSLRAFQTCLRAEPWDLVIHTHFLSAELFARLRRRGQVDLPHMTVTTDFDAHRFWANLPCERFFVATAEAAAALGRWGVPEENVSVSGIPIHPAFSRPPRREDCLAAQGLTGHRPVILQLSGGAGLGPIDEIYAGLLSLETPVDIVVVTGKNAAARDRLRLRRAPARHRARVLGYTDKIHELMGAADLLVSKPGGLTSAESLACGLPMVAIDPIPGQESRNCDFLLENGAGIKLGSTAALGRKLDLLLADPRRLATMRRNAWRLGRPEAAFDVAQEAVELAAGRALAA